MYSIQLHGMILYFFLLQLCQSMQCIDLRFDHTQCAIDITILLFDLS